MASIAAVLAVEDARRAVEVIEGSMPATFTTEPLGASDPREDGDAADRVERAVERVHDVAVGRRRVERRKVLGHGLAR